MLKDKNKIKTIQFNTKDAKHIFDQNAPTHREGPNTYNEGCIQ